MVIEFEQCGHRGQDRTIGHGSNRRDVSMPPDERALLIRLANKKRGRNVSVQKSMPTSLHTNLRAVYIKVI